MPPFVLVPPIDAVGKASRISDLTMSISDLSIPFVYIWNRIDEYESCSMSLCKESSAFSR